MSRKPQHLKSAGQCPRCGQWLRLVGGPNTRVRVHEVGGLHCRVQADNQEVAASGLMFVSPEMSVIAANNGVPYRYRRRAMVLRGNVVYRSAPVLEDWIFFVLETLRDLAPRPRGGVVTRRGSGDCWTWHTWEVASIQRGYADAEFRTTVAALGRLMQEDEAARKEAVWALLRETFSVTDRLAAASSNVAELAKQAEAVAEAPDWEVLP